MQDSLYKYNWLLLMSKCWSGYKAKISFKKISFVTQISSTILESIRGPWISMAGLHKLRYPGIRDTSTWSKFGAHGEHGDVFLFSNLGALWFSENRALVLGEFDIWIKIFIVCLFKGSQKQSFFLQTLLFTAFLVMVLKMLTYALVSTWSSVSSG